MPYTTDPREIKNFFNHIEKIQTIKNSTERNQAINLVFEEILNKDTSKLTTLYNLFSESSSDMAYQQLLIYATLRVLLEQNGVAQEQAKKLYTLFDNDLKKIKKYLSDFAKDNRDSPEPMHDACMFAIPPKDSKYNVTVWSELSLKYLKDKPFRQLLAQAPELEELIKTQERAIKPNKPMIAALVSEIDSLNRTIKKRESHINHLTPEQEAELKQDKTTLMSKKAELTTLGIPFNNELTLTALGAFREKYLLVASTSYKQFLENGLTKKDHDKFTELERQDNDTIIPPLRIDGATIGHPGYYLMKVPVMDEAHAARAAYFGKLTECCQSLSGEAGEPCVIHGLTSLNGGFYVICHGDVANPQITDEVLGQSWVWRGKTNALVFDSVETTPNDTGIYENTDEIVTNLVRAASKQLVEQYNIDRVLCGANSGISAEVGFAEALIPEQFKDYQDHSDAKKQLILRDKHQPFYLFEVNEEGRETTIQWITEKLKDKEPLSAPTSLWAALNWAILSKNTRLIETIQNLAAQPKNNRLEEVNVLIKNLNEYIAQGLTPNILSAIEQNSFPLEGLNHSQQTPLLMTASSGDIRNTLSLIKKGANFDHVNRYKETALILAAAGGHLDCVIALINANANLEHKDGSQQTALMLAAIGGYLDCVTALINANAKLERKNGSRKTALMLATERGHLECVIELINAGADVNHVDILRNTALTAAIKNGYLNCLQVLIKAKAQFEDMDEEQNTPLLLAVDSGNIGCVRALINANANLNHVNDVGKTALMIAARMGNLDCIIALIQANAKLELLDQNGRTALIFAAWMGHPKCVIELIKAGANVNHVDNTGKTALMLAAERGRLSCVQELIKANAHLEQVNQKGQTALILAACAGKLDCVKELLKAKANPKQIDAMGKTALDYAIETENNEIIAAIEDELKDIEAQKINPSSILMSESNPEKVSETKSAELDPAEPPLVIKHRRPSR